MENPSQRPGGIGSFFKGFMSSAGSGALMSGIFYVMAMSLNKFVGVNLLHFTSTAFLGTTGMIAGVMLPALLMVAAVGVFGGVMAIVRENNEAKAAGNVSQVTVRARDQEVAASMVPMMATAVAADRAEAPEATSTAWRDRMGSSGDHRDRVQQILANGSMSDKDRASAILAERQASATNQNQL